MRAGYEELGFAHLGADDEVSVLNQIDEAIQRVALLVDRGDHADKGSVSVAIKIRKVVQKEEGEVIDEHIEIDAIVTSKEPHRIVEPLEIVCDHEREKVLVRATQLSLLDGISTGE